MRRYALGVILVLLIGCLTGCVEKPLKTEKIRELEFVTLTEEEIPKELQEQIEKEKAHAFRMSYHDADILYIAEGYGAQPKTGYRVEVVQVNETENAISFHTHLLGPEKGMKTEEIEVYPYVVIVIKDIGKAVIFE